MILEKMAWQAAHPRKRRQALHIAGLGFWMNGDRAKACASLEAAVRTCEAAAFWSYIVKSATHLADIYWVEGDNVLAQSWLETAAVALTRSASNDFCEAFYGTSLLVALDQGRIQEAETLHSKAIQHSPRVRSGRPGVVGLAYSIRIAVAKGTIPDPSETNSLVAGLRRFQPYGLMDEVAEAAVIALRAQGP